MKTLEFNRPSLMRKEIKRAKKKNQNFCITPCDGKYILRLHNGYMGTYKTRQACQQVIDIHHRREVMRAIEKQKESIDTYYDDL